jgi:hypothetical protein
VRRARIRTLTGAGLALLLGASPARPAHHPLRVSPDRRHLIDASGAPFLYLADTAWQLFQRLTREEARAYLEDRAAKGFTVVQAVVLGTGGLDVPNAYGDHAFVAKDPRQPNEAYFAHVDWIVDRAGTLGLTIGMLPTWGDVWHSRQTEPGPKVFDAAKALAYGRFVGRRYRGRPVLFILGGDRNAETEADRAIVRAIAAGLEETAPAHLVTYHPRGPGRSSDVFHREDWLDFNMIQSSHAGRGADTGLNVEHDRALTPTKPTLDGEPRYEALIVGFYNKGADPALRFDDYDVRLAAYRALLAGAAGHTYGNNNVWQMWAPGRPPQLGADTPWYEALDHPGAFQMGPPPPPLRVAPLGDARARAGLRAGSERAGRRLRARGRRQGPLLRVRPHPARRDGGRRPGPPGRPGRHVLVVRSSLWPRLQDAHGRRHRRPVLHPTFVRPRL